MFDTLLIANRGEIACRVIRTARAMGLRTVAVYSAVDADALHVQLADTALCIGPGPARESYLHIERVLEACRRSGAQAVHPGYGFLSENAAFARACRDACITFVGPSPEAMDALGNKAAAKAFAESAGVPVLPGYRGADQSLDTLVREARRIGAPLMIKATAGGGGRGMRRCDDVNDEAALRELLHSAASEALGSFGNGELLLERLVENARHVEIQVFGDSQGHAVHLGERDCSTQRRHQKILEEAPAPGMTAALRERMGAAAVALVKAAQYVGAGTVEFLLAPNGAFHFLEVNTRLQVEHPVTEALTGLDLVEWQLRIAQGEALPLAQDAITWQGHAIEARLCAEDAHAGFAPQSGAIPFWQVPALAGLRVDHGLAAQPTVPPQYDSMLAKLIAHGRTREEARQRLLAALRGSVVLGLRSNRDYLLQCLAAEPFATAALHTGWLGEASAAWTQPSLPPAWWAVAGAVLLQRRAAAHGPLARFSSVAANESRLRLGSGDLVQTVQLRSSHREPIQVTVADESFTVDVLQDDGLSAHLLCNGLRQTVQAHAGWLQAFGHCAALADLSDSPPVRRDAAASGEITSRMHGAVVRLNVAEGQVVSQGELLLTIEAMKMEHRIEAPCQGTVRALGAALGMQVAPGQLLVRIEA